MQAIVKGNKIVTHDGYSIAECDDANKAAEMLNKAWLLNDGRQYTASARLLAKAEQLPGFAWKW